MLQKYFTVFILTLIVFASSAQDNSLYEKKLLIVKGDTMPYRLLMPENYDPAKKYPVILFLHGSGERGNNNQSQLLHGGFLFLVDSIRDKYPAIVIFPQCSAKGTWAKGSPKRDSAGKFTWDFQVKSEPTKDMILLQKLLKSVIHHYAVNKRMIYVGGLSLGGMGTYDIVQRNPKLFAAAFPICGAANAGIAPQLKHVNWWIFHGADDKNVNPEFDKKMVVSMQQLNIPVQFSLYPNTGHNSWDKVFVEPTLFSWLFSNVKK